MALTRKYLQGMGLTEEQVSAITESNEETIAGLKKEISKYKAEAEKLPDILKELDTAKEAMANGDKSPYKVKYEAIVEEKEELQKQFDEFKAEVQEKEDHAKKADAYKQLLKDAGVSEKRIDAILKITDVSDIEFDEKGNVKNAEKLTEDILREWSDFIVTKSTEGVSISTPPQTTGGNAPMTKADIMKITDTAERQQAWTKFLEYERKK